MWWYSVWFTLQQLRLHQRRLNEQLLVWLRGGWGRLVGSWLCAFLHTHCKNCENGLQSTEMSIYPDSNSGKQHDNTTTRCRLWAGSGAGADTSNRVLGCQYISPEQEDQVERVVRAWERKSANSLKMGTLDLFGLVLGWVGTFRQCFRGIWHQS